MYVSDTLAKALLRVREMEITPETTRELARRLEDEHHEVAFQTFTWPNHTDILRGVAEVEQQHMSLREIEMAEWSAEIEAEMPRLAWEFWRDWVKKYPDAIPELTTMMTLWDVFFPPNPWMLKFHLDYTDEQALALIDEEPQPWLMAPIEFDQTLEVTSDWEKITPDTLGELELLHAELAWSWERMARIALEARLDEWAASPTVTGKQMLSATPMKDDMPMIELALGILPRDKAMDILIDKFDEMVWDKPTPDWLPEAVVAYQHEISPWTVDKVLGMIGLRDNSEDMEWTLKWEAFELKKDDHAFTQWDARLEMALVGFQAMTHPDADPAQWEVTEEWREIRAKSQREARDGHIVERLATLKARLNA